MLFQLKPVSNLSNTIISLISLIPDIFKPDTANNGLEFCSGFFDSIDLVNSELGRKANAKSRQAQSTANRITNIKKGATKKKRILSFSNKKQQPDPHKSSPTSLGSNSTSPVSSANSSPLTGQTKNEDNSTPITSTPTTKKNARNSMKTNSKSSHNLSLSTDQTSTNPDLQHSSSSNDSTVTTKLPVEDLLQIDFGMPYNLFSQFNILHPYLSLYYLDYFAMINKMSTKLYCTTSLMLSMMSQANVAEEEPNKEEIGVSSGTSSMGSTASESNGGQRSVTGQQAKWNPTQQKPQLNIGYTIGATNVLFKQRLYDDIDVFVDEATIDLKQNDTLKKQLQLTTADLRFADYLIKNVNSNRSLQQKAYGNSHNTPTLLSVKKTGTNSSFSDVDENSMNNSSTLSSSNWEGSDEWIRLNFKWYFYSMLGSLVKEEIHMELRQEADVLVAQLTELEMSNLTQQNKEVGVGSSSSSSASLANEVVDIDEYIERASVVRSSTKSSKKKLTSAKFSTYSLNPGNEPTNVSKSGKSLKTANQSQYSLDLSSASSTLVSAQNYLGSSNSNTSGFSEDFSAAYLGEFKLTECFNNWIEANRGKLEISLFKMNEMELETKVGTENLETDTQSLNTQIRLQSILRKLHHLDQTNLTHPFSGNLGMHDLKLKFNFLFTTTDSGKKLNKALSDTSKMVNTTGRAMGDALSQAKSSFSSFLSNWTTTTNSAGMRGNSSSGNNGKSNRALDKLEATDSDGTQKFTNI